MIREAKEEVDILVQAIDLKLVHVSNNLISDPERVDFFFTCERWIGEIKVNEPNKCDEYCWVELDNLPTNIVETVKIALLESAKGNNYSELRN
jgi:8-oxo-dGTP diphosphatase